MEQKKTPYTAPKYPFLHSMPAQLRFNDIDVLGHVNNSVYFQLFDLAKAKYFNAVRQKELEWSETDIVIVNVNCNFLSQTFFNEPLDVLTQVEKIGEKSLTLVQQLVNTATGEVKSHCTTIMVGFDAETQTSKPITTTWRQAISTFEQRES